jgi:hypothetical protein
MDSYSQFNDQHYILELNLIHDISLEKSVEYNRYYSQAIDQIPDNRF